MNISFATSCIKVWLHLHIQVYVAGIPLPCPSGCGRTLSGGAQDGWPLYTGTGMSRGSVSPSASVAGTPTGHVCQHKRNSLPVHRQIHAYVQPSMSARTKETFLIFSLTYLYMYNKACLPRQKKQSFSFHRHT